MIREPTLLKDNYEITQNFMNQDISCQELLDHFAESEANLDNILSDNCKNWP